MSTFEWHRAKREDKLAALMQHDVDQAELSACEASHALDMQTRAYDELCIEADRMATYITTTPGFMDWICTADIRWSDFGCKPSKVTDMQLVVTFLKGELRND